MNDQTQKLLQQLADKLGVTVQYLWTTLVRGNRVEGAILMVYALAGIGLIYFAYVMGKRALAAESYSDAKLGYGIASTVSTIVGLAMFFGFGYWGIMDTFCPEYGALADILSHIGK